jgi:HAD superfamily hydrolase (TIGR01549 family)
VPGKIVSSLKGRTIRCILFDFGDTLWTRKDAATWHRTERAGNQRVVELLKKIFPGTALPTSDPMLFGEQFRKAVEVQANNMKTPSHEPDFELATIKALQQLGFPVIERTTACEIFEALRVRIPESRHLFDDILPTLAELQHRGFLLGVVTNRWYGGEPFLEDLQSMGLLDYFDANHMAISADLGVRKPNPAIFQHALDALGVPAEEAAMVGDAFGADIVGAKQLNIFAIWKPKARLRAEVRKTLPPGTQLDGDHLAAYAYKREAKKYGLSPEDSQTRPDLIIEHLSELLDVFPKAGLQQ